MHMWVGVRQFSRDFRVSKGVCLASERAQRDLRPRAEREEVLPGQGQRNCGRQAVPGAEGSRDDQEPGVDQVMHGSRPCPPPAPSLTGSFPYPLPRLDPL